MLAEPLLPSPTISDQGPSKGPKDALVTIIEFSDFQCPYCKQAVPILEQLLQYYSGKVRVVFKQLPLPIHSGAFKAAQASICAEQQGKFWEYHDLLFSSNDLSTEALTKYAMSLKLGINDFDSCLNSEASRLAVLRDMQEARRVDIQGTPSFIINGRVLRGIKSIDDFKFVIDREIKRKSNELKPGSGS